MKPITKRMTESIQAYPIYYLTIIFAALIGGIVGSTIVSLVVCVLR